MTTLKELLDTLEIDTKDLEEKEEKEAEVDIKDIKLDEIPEAQRPIFKRLIDETENLKNEVATRDIAIKTLKSTFKEKPLKQEKKKEDVSEEKVLGVLDPTDPYAPAFKKLSDMIEGVVKKEETNKEEDFKTNIINFAKEHKDIVRYAEIMDRLVEEYPKLMNNIPRLYNLAKLESEGRANTQKEKEKELERQGKLKSFSTERSGTDSRNVSGASGNAKSIAEAFNQSEKQLSTRR